MTDSLTKFLRHSGLPLVWMVLLAGCVGSATGPASSNADSDAPDSSAVAPMPSSSSAPSSSAAASRPPCPFPEDLGTCLGEMRTGDYSTATFSPSFRYSLPHDGWQNWEDWERTYLLMPPGAVPQETQSDTQELIVVARGIAAAPADCSESGLEPSESATAVAAAIAAHPGLVVTEAESVSLGGLEGVVIDVSLEPGWKGECPFAPGVPLVPLIVSSGDSAVVRDVVQDGFTVRIYLLDVGGEVVAIKAVDQEGGLALTDLDEVVRSFDFGASPATSAPAPPPPPTKPTWTGSVDVGGGRTVFGQCFGDAEPRVLVEGFHWPATMVNAIATEATFCEYETDGGVGSTTAAIIVDDAWKLVDEIGRATGLDGPTVFMGWSLGATKALGIASAHPERAAGLVILDVDFPVDFFTACPTWGWTDAECQAEYAQDKEAKDTDGAVAAAVRPMPGIPIKLITAMLTPDCIEPAGGEPLRHGELSAQDCAALNVAIADRMQRQWAEALGPQVEQVRVPATHGGLPFDGEAEVTAMVLEAVAEAKQRAAGP